MSPEELIEQKQIQFYAAGLAAWYNSALEHDKSIFALSAGGIGLLLTLLTTIGVGSVCLLVLYIASIVCFLGSLVVVLVIFRRNRTHIEQVFSGTAQASDPLLERLDIAAIAAFGLGAVLASVVAMSVAVNSFVAKEKERAMANEGENQSSVPVPLKESFNKVTNLQPGADLGKSFNGVGNLQPQPVASTPPATPAAPVPVPQPGASTPSPGK